MKYQELYDEYNELLQRFSSLTLELQELPRGYICTKTISGKEYYYLQYTHLGKKKSEYIRETLLSETKTMLERRDAINNELAFINQEMNRLETAVRILSPNLSQLFFYTKQCAQMDAMPITKRSKAISFSKAITDLEGLPATSETEENLLQWANGHKSFADVYLPTLNRYQMIGAI